MMGYYICNRSSGFVCVKGLKNKFVGRIVKKNNVLHKSWMAEYKFKWIWAILLICTKNESLVNWLVFAFPFIKIEVIFLEYPCHSQQTGIENTACLTVINKLKSCLLLGLTDSTVAVILQFPILFVCSWFPKLSRFWFVP